SIASLRTQIYRTQTREAGGSIVGSPRRSRGGRRPYRRRIAAPARDLLAALAAGHNRAPGSVKAPLPPASFAQSSLWRDAVGLTFASIGDCCGFTRYSCS